MSVYNVSKGIYYKGIFAVKFVLKGISKVDCFVKNVKFLAKVVTMGITVSYAKKGSIYSQKVMGFVFKIVAPLDVIKIIKNA